MPSTMLKAVYNALNQKQNRELIDAIKSGLSYLKDDIKEIVEDEIEIEKPHKIVNTVQKILHFGRQNQEGQGIKILTPDQMVSRLPIILAQLKAGNCSETFKNEIRQILYLLYCSKNYPKQSITI